MNVAGHTLINVGVFLAPNMLNVVTGVANEAPIIFTGGIENRVPFIRDVLASIN